MGGTVLDMFTLDATPLSLSYLLFFFREGDTVVLGISPTHLPLSSSICPSSICSSLHILFSLSFFFYFREFSQKRHANTRSTSDQLCRADESQRETLEFWLNTVLLMDGASGSGSWKHVMRLSDRW